MNPMHKNNPGYHYHRKHYKINPELNGKKKKSTAPTDQDILLKQALDCYESRQFIDEDDPLF